MKEFKMTINDLAHKTYYGLVQELNQFDQFAIVTFHDKCKKATLNCVLKDKNKESHPMHMDRSIVILDMNSAEEFVKNCKSIDPFPAIVPLSKDEVLTAYKLQVMNCGSSF